MKICIFPDFAEEQWPSMDLCAEMLLRELNVLEVLPEKCIPSFFAPCSPRFHGRARRLAFNLERLWNRFATYPKLARHVARNECSQSTLFHVVDHSYSQLVHALPCDRTGVYCHDLDAFRSVLGSPREKRPWWFRHMAHYQLAGLRKAAIVFCNSLQTQVQLINDALIAPNKIVHAPLGISDEFLDAGKRSLASASNSNLADPWILHVGSAIPRKRIDVLLHVLREARRTIPNLRLVKVGGDWTDEHQTIIDSSNLRDCIDHRVGLSRSELAELYRNANLVLVPSESEGFGLPVIEAMACGAPVLCSDIPVLREVGGQAALYEPVADIIAWTRRVVGLLAGTETAPDPKTRIAWANQFSWANHAKIIAEAYRTLADRSIAQRNHSKSPSLAPFS